jgi:hypothetical protein
VFLEGVKDGLGGQIVYIRGAWEERYLSIDGVRLLPDEVQMLRLEIPEDLLAISERIGFGELVRIDELNRCPELKLEPIPPDYERWVLKFVPFSER